MDMDQTLSNKDCESVPIKTLDEFLEWTAEKAGGLSSQVPLPSKNAWTQSAKQRRTLLCHDMKGGYLADRFTRGCRVAANEPYVFYHWSHIHAFIYFSHNFVTIPPTGWINAAHRNGVPVFGTLITEWDDGKAIWNRLTKDEELLKKMAKLLVQVADYYGFDGWLINIENSIEPEDVDKITSFLHWLRQDSQMGGQKPLTVIWYDSITIKGDLKWQNTLNDHNTKFFQFVDGIFLNYNWSFADLETAKKTATVFRQYDVFVGVDVFGRGCYGGGGWNTSEALEVISQHDMSVALFAPGWVLECVDCNDPVTFMQNQDKFWRSLSKYLPKHKISSFPLKTSFCVGYGKSLFRDGRKQTSVNSEATEPSHWFDLTAQHIQPCWDSKSDSASEKQCMVSDDLCLTELHHDNAWNGGGCLKLVIPDRSSSVTFVLFRTTAEVTRALSIRLTAKLPSEEICRCSLVLTLKCKTTNSPRQLDLLLCSDNEAASTDGNSGFVSDGASVLLPLEIVKSECLPTETCWCTFRFLVDELLTVDIVMEEIAFNVKNPAGCSVPCILLGELQMELK